MPYRVAFQDGLIRAELEGAVTPEDLHGMVREVIDLEARLERTPCRIFDCRGVDRYSPVLHYAVVDLARQRRSAILRNPIRSAIVADSPVAFGYARVFQTLLDNPRIDVRIYRSMEEAVAWMAEPPPPSDDA